MTEEELKKMLDKAEEMGAKRGKLEMLRDILFAAERNAYRSVNVALLKEMKNNILK